MAAMGDCTSEVSSSLQAITGTKDIGHKRIRVVAECSSPVAHKHRKLGRTFRTYCEVLQVYETIRDDQYEKHVYTQNPALLNTSSNDPS